MIYKVKAACGWVSHYDAMAQSRPQSISKTPRISLPKAIKPSLSKKTDSVEQVSPDNDIVTPLPKIEPEVVKPQEQDTFSPQKTLNLRASNDDWDYP